jgi:hypothetical protein
MRAWAWGPAKAKPQIWLSIGFDLRLRPTTNKPPPTTTTKARFKQLVSRATNGGRTTKEARGFSMGRHKNFAPAAPSLGPFYPHPRLQHRRPGPWSFKEAVVLVCCLCWVGCMSLVTLVFPCPPSRSTPGVHHNRSTEEAEAEAGRSRSRSRRLQTSEEGGGRGMTRSLRSQ